ncbi:hypothetical protein GCM10023083_22400 [Streptomyces phyllanthi]
MDSPVAAADPVIWRTSRFCTVSCIHVPAFDTKFATDHQRMLRYLRDRHGERGAPLDGAESGRAEEGAEVTERYSRRIGDPDGSGTRRAEPAGARKTGCAARPLHRAGCRRGPSWQKGPPSPCPHPPSHHLPGHQVPPAVRHLVSRVGLLTGFGGRSAAARGSEDGHGTQPPERRVKA